MTPYLRIATALAAALALAACATNTADLKPKTALAQDPSCLMSETASRLPASHTNCSAFGRSYSSEDINRTGQTSAGDALRLLDPSITIHH